MGLNFYSTLVSAMILVAESLHEHEMLLRRLDALKWLFGPGTAISVADQGYESPPIKQTVQTPSDPTREH